MQQTDNVPPVKEQEKQDQTQVTPPPYSLSFGGQTIRNSEPNLSVSPLPFF